MVVYSSVPPVLVANSPAAPSTLINTLLAASPASLVVNVIFLVAAAISNLSPSDVLDKALPIAPAVSSPVAFLSVLSATVFNNSLPS